MAVGVTTHAGLVDTRNARDRQTDGSYRYFPNNDYLYGPYPSKEAAFLKLSEALPSGASALVVGKTVGIIQADGSIKEYWFKNKCTSVTDLVEKEGLTEEQKQLLIDLENEVFKLSATFASNNAGTFETGTSVTPTVTLNITRKGVDVSADAYVSVTGNTTPTIAADKKSWTAVAISSGNNSYSTLVRQGEQTVKVGTLQWNFSFYRYRGEVADVPADYPTAIKALTTQELSTATTLGSTALSANKYYLFAVRIPDERLPRFIVRHAQTGGEISGIATGVCQVARKNGTGTEYYAYVLVPKSSSSWNFTISNS